MRPHPPPPASPALPRLQVSPNVVLCCLAIERSASVRTLFVMELGPHFVDPPLVCRVCSCGLDYPKTN